MKNALINRVDAIEMAMKIRLKGVKVDEILNELFLAAENFGIAQEIELQNNLAITILKLRESTLMQNTLIKEDWLYTAIKNTWYVIELYIKAEVSNGKLKLTDVISCVKNGRSLELIEKAEKDYIERLKKAWNILDRTIKMIPRNKKAFYNTRQYAKELREAWLQFANYKETKEELTELASSKFYQMNAPVLILLSMKGFTALEKAIKYLYMEISILMKFPEGYIHKLWLKRKSIMPFSEFEFNLFESVINNYLFSAAFMGEKENIDIERIDAILIGEAITSKKVTAEELTDTLISMFEFNKEEIKYLRKYQRNLQLDIDTMRKHKRVNWDVFQIA